MRGYSASIPPLIPPPPFRDAPTVVLFYSLRYIHFCYLAVHNCSKVEMAQHAIRGPFPFIDRIVKALKLRGPPFKKNNLLGPLSVAKASHPIDPRLKMDFGLK